ncbi:MAG: hypothetical protein WBX01_09115 [Nitrososphaeraceae archaeon]
MSSGTQLECKCNCHEGIGIFVTNDVPTGSLAISRPDLLEIWPTCSTCACWIKAKNFESVIGCNCVCHKAYGNVTVCHSAVGKDSRPFLGISYPD